jgi:hypothetical protein
MLFLRSDLENENVLNLFIYKGINSVKFVKLILKLFDEIEGISYSDKKLLTLHYVEGKTESEIDKIIKSKKITTQAQIKGASRRLLRSLRYFNSKVKNAEIIQEKNWGLETRVKNLKKQLDFVMEQLNRLTPNSINHENIDFLKAKPIDLDFSNRVLNCFKEAQINSMADLLQYSCRDLRKFRNLGVKSLEEITDLLKAHGYELKV